MNIYWLILALIIGLLIVAGVVEWWLYMDRKRSGPANAAFSSSPRKDETEVKK